MTTADQEFDSLVAAMAKARIPAENHEFIGGSPPPSASPSTARWRTLASRTSKPGDVTASSRICTSTTATPPGSSPKRRSSEPRAMVPGACPIPGREPGTWNTRLPGCVPVGSAPATRASRTGLRDCSEYPVVADRRDATTATSRLGRCPELSGELFTLRPVDSTSTMRTTWASTVTYGPAMSQKPGRDLHRVRPWFRPHRLGASHKSVGDREPRRCSAGGRGPVRRPRG